MKRSSMSCSLHQSENVWLVSLGPLSQRIALGRPCSSIIWVRNVVTRAAGMLSPTSMPSSPIGLVDYVQRSDDAPAVERVAHEIDGPDRIHPRLHQQRLSFPLRQPPETAAPPYFDFQ